jgi:glycine cleavage system aminomethyltransferase T
VRVSGEDAFTLVDAITPRPLFLRDGQALHSLLLDQDGHVAADLYVCADDLDYLLIAEGLTGEALIAWLRAHGPPDLDVQLTDLDADHRVFSLDGPYAWELMGDLVGPEVIGVPYLSTFTLDPHPGLGLRAGKTGEFGYLLLIPAAAAESVLHRLRKLGELFDLVGGNVDALDLAALENGFFSIRAPGSRTLSVAELQLLWRLEYEREAPGLAAVREARSRVEARITWFLGPSGEGEVPAPGTPAFHGRTPLGTVVQAAWSPTLEAVIGTLLLPLSHAHPGLTDLQLGDLGQVRTVSAPLLWNRSLAIDPQRHCFAGRDVDAFPPIAPQRTP